MGVNIRVKTKIKVKWIAADKTEEVVGKGLKKSFGAVKGVGSVLKKGIKGEDKK